jgi:hypothetical protein
MRVRIRLVGMNTIPHVAAVTGAAREGWQYRFLF